MKTFLFSAYRTDEGKPWVLPVVRHVEQLMAADMTLNKEYLPVLVYLHFLACLFQYVNQAILIPYFADPLLSQGFEPLAAAATRMLLGPDSQSLKEGRATGIQCLSGTGALRVGAEFLARVAKHKVVYSSNPTWGNVYILSINVVLYLSSCLVNFIICVE